MTKNKEEEDELVLPATGPAGPIAHADYCTRQCYEGKRERRSSCECRGCDGDAHGLGEKYAFDQGYLKHALHASRKPKHEQELLYSEEDLVEVVTIDPRKEKIIKNQAGK